ncbi:unnamed protein product [Didymodactylos carnosus]|uniref:Uncharacterized protein n=1 Tax=Didymodactylos carnosus TaxID=1234261 RepID=A0A816B079_9BILA|nr:unnamed protein product [Didymodactylos carnosus]CAF4478779.1 unnamed protein product [Didymodactylos carnosus]
MTKDSVLSSITNKKPIIALDCDGVLLDHHAAFAQIYEKTFGKQLTVVSPNSLFSANMYGVQFTPEEKCQFYAVWDDIAWRTMPMLDGALQACLLLHQVGYELVCVTAMPPAFTEHRLENFRLYGFPIDRVISTDYDRINPSNNPKKQTIEELHPVVFVDDKKRNFKNIQGVHTRFVYIDRQCHDDPEKNENIYYDVKYPSLLAFVNDFLQTKHGQEIAWTERPTSLLLSTS